jgi:histidinol dehydrogenase
MAGMQVRRYAALTEEERRALLVRGEREFPELVAQVREIVEAVRKEGDMALCRFARQFDQAELTPERILVEEEAFARAEARVPEAVREAIDEAIVRVRRFHERQLPEPFWLEEFPEGLLAGEQTVPIASAGLYVPRGKGSFPSVMVMLGVPATVAGVPEVAVATPPGPDGEVDAATLYAAGRLGLRRVYRMGGAQAIAALAYGTETVRPVAKLFGPGNPYVAVAKELVGAVVDTGLRSGPSEAIVLADGEADARAVALDLLNEAEHGPDSSALLVTTDEALAARVAGEVADLLGELPEPRRGYVARVLGERGGALVFEDEGSLLAFVNAFAVEHLAVHVADPWRLVPKLAYAGEIIIGPHTTIAACNYLLGPNAVLPTAGFARSMSALSVRDFLRTSSVVALSPEGFAKASPSVAVLAEYEGFPAHALNIRRHPALPERAPRPRGLTWLAAREDEVLVRRTTRESRVTVGLRRGPRDVALKRHLETPSPFLNHMLETVAWRLGLNLSVSVALDGYRLMHVVAEDVGITLGEAFRRLLSASWGRGVEGAGHAVGVIDEARAFVALSFEERALFTFDRRVAVPPQVEDMLSADMENVLAGFAQGAGATLHVVLDAGEDPHHIWEAVFRAFGEALKATLAPNPFRAGTTPGVKGF